MKDINANLISIQLEFASAAMGLLKREQKRLSEKGARPLGTFDEEIKIAMMIGPLREVPIQVLRAAKHHIAHHMCIAYAKTKTREEKILLNNLFMDIFSIKITPEFKTQKEAL